MPTKLLRYPRNVFKIPQELGHILTTHRGSSGVKAQLDRACQKKFTRLTQRQIRNSLRKWHNQRSKFFQQQPFALQYRFSLIDLRFADDSINQCTIAQFADRFSDCNSQNPASTIVNRNFIKSIPQKIYGHNNHMNFF